jgi:hypothetical protein
MKKPGILLISLGIIVTLLLSCGTAHKTAKTKAENIRTVWIKKFDIVDCKDEKMIGKAGIRYIKDSVLLMTLRNRSGMEGARMYVYKDSIFFFNRVKKNWFAERIVGDIKQEMMNGMKQAEELILRTGKQKKYFEVNMGGKNSVSLYVMRYKEIGKKIYMPEDITIKLMYRNNTYCYRLKDPVYMVNEIFSVERIHPGKRYRKVMKLDEAL